MNLPVPFDDGEGKPNDKCITCALFGDICTGTNPLAMIDPDSPRPLERFGQFCRALKEHRQKQDPKWTNQYVADEAKVSKATVDRFFLGYMDDGKISTVVRIYRVLVNGIWREIPCSLEFFKATLKQLRAELAAKDEQLQKLRAENQALEKKLSYALEDAEHFKDLSEKNYSQMILKDDQLDYRRSALNYRGRMIVFLVVLCVLLLGLAIYGLWTEPIIPTWV